MGAHAPKVRAARELLSPKGRREQARFAFEGGTLLAEARRSGVLVEEIFLTEAVLRHNSDVAELERNGTAVHVVDERTAAKLSDLEAPSGLIAVAAIAYRPLDALLREAGLVVVLGDLNDPGNAGTLVRSAEAFGASGIVFGSGGVDPHHPKVVRAAMGSIFRLPMAVCDARAFGAAARAANLRVWGLDAGGESLEGVQWQEPSAVVVGHERRGLEAWEAVCGGRLAIPMSGPAESLNAAIAGSIVLYEASKRHLE